MPQESVIEKLVVSDSTMCYWGSVKVIAVAKLYRELCSNVGVGSGSCASHFPPGTGKGGDFHKKMYLNW